MLYSFYVAPEEITVAVCDDNPDRLEMARLYNEVKFIWYSIGLLYNELKVLLHVIILHLILW